MGALEKSWTLPDGTPVELVHDTDDSGYDDDDLDVA